MDRAVSWPPTRPAMPMAETPSLPSSRLVKYCFSRCASICARSVAASAMLLAVTCSNCMVSMRALRSASPISPSSALPSAATCSANVVPGCTT